MPAIPDDEIGLVYAGLCTGTVFYPTGHVAALIEVQVRLKGQSDLATIYSDRTKAATVGNPVSTDAQGNYAFYVAPDIYTLTFPATGGAADVMVPADPLDIRTSGTDNLVASVNDKIGDVVLSAADVGAVAQVNGHTGTSINLTAADVGGVDDSLVVHLAGSETITGSKNFSANPTVPAPTATGHASTKGYVDTGLTGKVDTTRQVATGAGLTGGGALSADRTLTPDWGTSSTQVPRGNHVHLAPTIVTLTDAATVTIDASTGSHFRLTATSGIGSTRALGPPTNATDGQRIVVEYVQDGVGSRALTLSTATGGFVASPEVSSYTATTAASKRDFLGLMYSSALSRWVILAVSKGN